MEIVVGESFGSFVYDGFFLGDEERKVDVSLWKILRKIIDDCVISSRRRSKRGILYLVWNEGWFRIIWYWRVRFGYVDC